MMNGWGFGYGMGFNPLWMLVIAALVVVPFWRICEKAGFNGALSLLVLVPLANLLFLYWLAFSEWPARLEPAKPAA